MAQERPLSPEKQLLKLIEGGAAPASNFKTAGIRRQGASLFSFNAWFGRFLYIRDRLHVDHEFFKTFKFDIRIANLVLSIIVGLLAIHTVNFFIRSSREMKIASLQEIATEESQGDLTSFKNPLKTKPFAYYLEKVSARNIFKIGAKKAVTGVKEIAGPSSTMMDATANLRLVGISWSDDPDAMIEDTKAMRTMFVKRGQMVGDLRVSAIFKDKVILSNGKEEIDLR